MVGGEQGLEKAAKRIVNRGGRARFDAFPFSRRTTMLMRRFAFVVALTCGVSGPLMWAQAGAATSNDEAQGEVWWAHVQKLAEPSRNGRLTGREDYLKAVGY